MKFENLMSCYHISEQDNNQKVYDKLVQQLRKQNITPLIGAGLSSWAYPLWGQMLSEQANFYGIKTEVDILLNEREYEEAASLLEKELTANRLTDILQGIFDPQKLKEKATSCPAYLEYIPKLFHGPIVTTNFDQMIEYLFTSKGKKRPVCVTPQDSFQTAQIENALHKHEPILIKIHGDIDDPNHMILTKKSYDNSYGRDPEHPDFTRSMPAFLRKILERNPLLFLGCSLGADRTCTVIRSCAPNHQHFAFLELPEETSNEQNPLQPILRNPDGTLKKTFKERCNEIIENFNIFPIWYPHGMHDEALHAFFTKLCEDLNAAASPCPAMDAEYALLHPLLGRSSQVDYIVKKLTDNTISCVCVVGPAGIGKTETCKAVYAALREKAPSLDMPYIDITGITSLLAFFTALADKIKISIPDGIMLNDIGSYLIERLEEKYPLQSTDKISRILYFDNWEDIWYGLGVRENREPLINWMKELVIRKFKLLVSSREFPASGLNSIIFRIEPLDSGKLNRIPLTSDELHTLDSVRLFRHITGQDIPQNQNELDAFSSLICQLEGHPLSIVLTATQAREGISINKLLDRWDKAKQDTTGIPDRYYNLEVALKVSWNAISTNPEAVLQWGLHYYSLKPIPDNVLMQLRGSASEEAWDEGLRVLARANLIYTIPDSESVAMLLPLKKQFIHLSDKPTQKICLFRWAQYIENLLVLSNQLLSENRQKAHYAAMESIPQIFYIMEQLMTYGTDSAKEHLDRIVRKVRHYYQFNLQSVSLLKKLIDYYNDSNSPNLLAIIYHDYGVVLSRIDSVYDAMTAYDHAEPLYRQTGDMKGLANLLKSRGNLLKYIGNMDDANKVYDCAEALMREIHDEQGLADLLKSRGDLARRIGNMSDALRFYNSAEPLYCQTNNNLGLANLRRSRGDVLKELGDLDGAKAAYDSVEELLSEERYILGLANLYESRGDLLRRLGDVNGAKMSYEKGEVFYRQIDDKHGLANLQKSLGDLLKDNNCVDDARKLYDIVEATYRQTNDRRGLANLYKSRGDLACQLEKTEDAWKAYEIAASYYHPLYDKPGLANLYKSQGDLAMHCNFPEQAYIFYKKAEELYQELGKFPQRVSTLTELGKCCRQLGKISEAEAIKKIIS